MSNPRENQRNGPAKVKKTESHERSDTDTTDLVHRKKDNSAFTLNMQDSPNNIKIDTTFEKELIADIESDVEIQCIQQFRQTTFNPLLNSAMKLLPDLPARSKNITLPCLVHPLKRISMTTKLIAQAPSEFKVDECSNADDCYFCKKCNEYFKTGQALGGHMSRKHPGQSEDYIHKKEIRDKRGTDRKKLLLAKIKYFDSIKMDFMKLKMTPEGREQIKVLLNRSRLKRLKQDITNDEVDQEFKCPTNPAE